MQGAGDHCRFQGCVERSPYEVGLSFRQCRYRAGLFTDWRRPRCRGRISLPLFSTLITATYLDDNRSTEPLKLRIIQILKRIREIAWQASLRRKRKLR